MNNIVCWKRDRIQYATAIDVGGLEVDDALGDAVFAAIHQEIPVLHYRDVGVGGSTSSATEDDVLNTFTAPLSSNEPRLVFIRGGRGTGKSHLVRWLKSQTGNPASWHIVYIEKRNTSLKRVTEKILAGITGERAEKLRRQLAQASSEVSSNEEAVSALIARLHHLVKFDTDQSIKGLNGLSSAELEDLRATSDRLLGDYTFRAVLSDSSGPLLRLVKLALGGADPGQNIDEEDLHLTERDLYIDPADFEDLGSQLYELVRRVRSVRQLRTELAALWDHYLPRAKAEVFTGASTDLLEVFEDVRREIASRGLELCVFIEDLVLLHGIDKQLAQALTIPASRELCKLRAAIAVTDGYLSSMDTFTDRGIHFTLDLGLTMVGEQRLRDFVGRYLNAGRLDHTTLVEKHQTGKSTPNGCAGCPVQESCHQTFGASDSKHGFYPFNRPALDRLIELASPAGFLPREIIRQVLRAPLETAEDEIPKGIFPSENFARRLDEVRSFVRPPAVRQAIKRLSPATGEAELSLRNFYAEIPPHADKQLHGVAAYLGIKLVDDAALDLDVGGRDRTTTVEKTKPTKDAPVDEIELWTTGSRLGAATARKVRKWICEAVVGILAGGSHGVEVWSPKASTAEWYIGSHRLRMSDVSIPRAQGGTAAKVGEVTFDFGSDDDAAVILTGIIAVVDGKEISSSHRGQWFLDLLPKLDRFAAELAAAGRQGRERVIAESASALMTLRNESPAPGSTVREALPQMLRPKARMLAEASNTDLTAFLKSVKIARRDALLALRNQVVASKGRGAPVLFDVASCYKYFRADIDSKVLTIRSSESTLPALADVVANQNRAAQRIGESLLGIVGKVRDLLPPEEDVTTVARLVIDLANEAQAHGVLGTADARDRIVDASRAIDSKCMIDYRRFAKTEADVRPEDVWDLIDDPRPRLQALLIFATLIDRMFVNVETYLAGRVDDSEGVDLMSAAQELRALADSVDVTLEDDTK
ncbi:hypothetical protein [Actinoplanes palleronii]|uniref:ATP-binding protein n=1 Tax=Actinoplanes palleronii TaxID=113570 RepID=A0ABQ4B1K8_9ACTN|nr:hypothetical protein [Actinoplanes palleronii]GIE64547.1 hypothetical protein Apa02nite_006550 [Actinoplanes palleronii]